MLAVRDEARDGVAATEAETEALRVLVAVNAAVTDGERESDALREPVRVAERAREAVNDGEMVVLGVEEGVTDGLGRYWQHGCLLAAQLSSLT